MKSLMECNNYDSGTMIRRQNPWVIGYRSKEFVELAKQTIEDHNKAMADGCYKRGHWFSDATVVFKSYQAAFIWLEECTGQISDGKYENSNLLWEWYANLQVRVDERLHNSSLLGPKEPKSKRVRFTDLMWLFDSGRKEKPLPEELEKDNVDVREIFSRMPTKELHAILSDIAHAVNGDYEYQEPQTPAVPSPDLPPTGWEMDVETLSDQSRVYNVIGYPNGQRILIPCLDLESAERVRKVLKENTVC